MAFPYRALLPPSEQLSLRIVSHARPRGVRRPCDEPFIGDDNDRELEQALGVLCAIIAMEHRRAKAAESGKQSPDQPAR
jgi:hypothetical protein